jgi:2-polyprenyl-6-methoxyphenol hydroxylase-like FAD-dependent oxidoreductase
MHETESILKNSLSDRPITSGWTEGNVTLLGDAAHPTTPNLGQGGCMAMEGAYILAQCLHEYGLSQDAYQRYEELQFPRAKKIVNESLRIGKIGQWENPIATSLRNWAFQLTPSKVAMRLIDQYFSYRVTQLSI